MSARRIVRRTLKKRRRFAKTNLNRVDALTDAQIQRACAATRTPPAILNGEWFKTAKVVMPEPELREGIDDDPG